MNSKDRFFKETRTTDFKFGEKMEIDKHLPTKSKNETLNDCEGHDKYFTKYVEKMMENFQTQLDSLKKSLESIQNIISSLTLDNECVCNQLRSGNSSSICPSVHLVSSSLRKEKTYSQFFGKYTSLKNENNELSPGKNCIDVDNFNNSVVVTNISKDVSHRELKENFIEFGKIVNIRFLDQSERLPTNVASYGVLITYNNPASCQKSITFKDFTKLMGVTLRVEHSAEYFQRLCDLRSSVSETNENYECNPTKETKNENNLSE